MAPESNSARKQNTTHTALHALRDYALTDSDRAQIEALAPILQPDFIVVVAAAPGRTPAFFPLASAGSDYFGKSEILGVFRHDNKAPAPQKMVLEILAPSVDQRSAQDAGARKLLAATKHYLKTRPELSATWEHLRRARHDHSALSAKPKVAELRAISRTAMGAYNQAPPHSLAGHTILFALHWFELGGAESFAHFCIKTAAEMGAKVLLVSTVPSPDQRLEAFSQHARLSLQAHRMVPPGMLLEVLSQLISAHQVGTLHIHHSAAVYGTLPSLKTLHPSLRVIDSLHICEAFTGGYPALSVHHDAYIDTHNVISTALVARMRRAKDIPVRKFALTYLHRLHAPTREEGVDPYAGKTTPRRILFLGRFSKQKRPELFVRMAHELETRGRAPRFVFEMYGSGELLPTCERYARRLGLKTLSFRGETAKGASVLKGAFAVVLPSENEGITLVSYEATERGCFYVSTDSGDQFEFVDAEFLVRPNPVRLPARLAAKIDALVNEENRYRAAFARQRARLSDFDHYAADRRSIAQLYQDPA